MVVVVVVEIVVVAVVVVVVVVVVEIVVVVVVVVEAVELADARSTTITCFVEGGLERLVNYFFQAHPAHRQQIT